LAERALRALVLRVARAGRERGDGKLEGGLLTTVRWLEGVRIGEGGAVALASNHAHVREEGSE
jgi:hypothetical protein